MKLLGWRQFESVRVAAAMSGTVAAMGCTSAWGTRSVLTANTGLEAKGRDAVCFYSFFPSLATSVAKAFLFLMPLVPSLEPASCA